MKCFIIFIANQILCYDITSSDSSLPSRRKKANIIQFTSRANDDEIPALFVDSDGYLEVHNDAGNIKEFLRPRVEIKKWYWVEISQIYNNKQKEVGILQILIIFYLKVLLKDAKFDIRISDGISWEKIKHFKSEVNNPETTTKIDIYAGKGSIHHMKAYYRYLVWSNTMLLFLVKPHQECFTIKEWGPIFRVTFQLYVASLPAKPNKVGVSSEDLIN